MSRSSKKPRLSCTKLFRLVETEVCKWTMGQYQTLIDGVTDMAATMERLDEYRTYNAQFCKRLFDFLKIMCDAQVCLPSSSR